LRNFSANDGQALPTLCCLNLPYFQPPQQILSIYFFTDCAVKNAKEPNYLAVKLAGKSFKEFATLGTICRLQIWGGSIFTAARPNVLQHISGQTSTLPKCASGFARKWNAYCKLLNRIGKDGIRRAFCAINPLTDLKSSKCIMENSGLVLRALSKLYYFQSI